jgi:hypothetical protein
MMLLQAETKDANLTILADKSQCVTGIRNGKNTPRKDSDSKHAGRKAGRIPLK